MSLRIRAGLLCVCLSFIGTHTYAQERTGWNVSAQTGRLSLDDVRGSGWAMHFGRTLGARGFFAELGILHGHGESESLRREFKFGTLDFRLGVRMLPRAVISPTVALGGGVWLPDGFFGRAGVGVDARLGSSLSISAETGRGMHEGQSGPNVSMLGVQWSFTRKPHGSS